MLDKPCRTGKGFPCGNKGQYRGLRINGKNVFLHRWVYTKCVGPIPEGMVVRHKCDNPACFEPTHLEVGTQADNIRDKVERGRHPSGSDDSRSLFTPEQIRYIRSRLAENKRGTQVKLARMFECSKGTINDIHKGRRYANQRD